MEQALARPIAALYAAAENLDPRLAPLVPPLRAAVSAAIAVTAAEPRKKALLDPLHAAVDALDECLEALPDTDVIFHHANLFSTLAASLAFVEVPTEPPSFLESAVEEGAENVTHLRAMSHPNHTALADAADDFLHQLQAYVIENFPKQLVYVDYDPTAAAEAAEFSSDPNDPPFFWSTPSKPAAQPAPDPEAAYVTAFKALLTGPLAAYVTASNAIGVEVAELAAAFASVWDAEAAFLSRAATIPEPTDVQPMLAPISAAMSEVAAVVEKVDPRAPLAHHCNAIGESVAALGWVAVLEKATAFVGEMAATGQFFLNKIKMAAKKTDNPQAHRDWANAVETLFADLKAYVKEYHTQKLVWNPPKVQPDVSKSGPTDDVDDDDTAGSDYVSAFKELIDGPLAAFVQASKEIGGEVAEQADAFASSWSAEAEFLAKAISMPKPDDIQDMLSPIAAKMGDVTAVVGKVDPRGPLAQHCNAVGESVAALGWVSVNEKATAFVGEMSGAGQFFLDKVKMAAKKSENPEVHRVWAKALETLFADLKAYVKEYHTQKLVWNPPKVTKAAKKSVVSGAEDDGSSSSDYVTAFKRLIDGPLAAFVAASSAIGAEVAEQATAFAAAWEAEAEFLTKAIGMPKPDDIQDMLAPIAAKMGEVSAVKEKVDPRGPLAQHCNAVGESAVALGWVAEDEKATAFVGDMAGAGQFFTDKVKMGAKKTDNPDAHKTWAKALETLFAELKAYVKEHHTQQLKWNSK